MSEQLPFFSIIIPTYGRSAQLRECLQAIDKLDYPSSRFEVIVVNDGYEPGPEEVILPFQEQLDIRLVSQKHAGPAAARNLGTSIARGDYYAFTDDDCLVSPEWLQILAARFSQYSNSAIGGRTINALSKNHFSVASQTVLEVVFAHFNSDPDHAEFVATNNMAVPALIFRSIGGFHEAFTTSEDRELCDRWLQQGLSLIYDPEVLIHHANPLTFRAFCKQHFNYGRGAHRFHALRAKRNSGRLKPDLHFYAKLLAYPFNEGHRKAWLVMTLTFASQVANVTGYLWQGLTQLRSKMSQVSFRSP